MQDTPLRNDAEEHDYHAGFARIMWLVERAREYSWTLTDRQIIQEIMYRERAAEIREKSSLPILGTDVRSAAWNHGQADALRTLLQTRRERYEP